MSDKSHLADTWQQGQLAQWAIEEEAKTLLGEHADTLDHIGTDHYDNSIELYFDPNCPSDFILNQDQRDGIAAMGFAHGWCNFTEGTECHFDSSTPGTRRKVQNPRWTLAKWEQQNPTG